MISLSKYLIFHIILAILMFVGFMFLGTQLTGATHTVDSYKITGIASNYECTAGWCDGTPTVALPEALGGRYIGEAHGTVTVCADRCVDLLVVDYCNCYWGTENQRVVDLNHAAWELVTDSPRSAGLVKVTVIYGASEIQMLPNTSMK